MNSVKLLYFTFLMFIGSLIVFNVVDQYSLMLIGEYYLGKAMIYFWEGIGTIIFSSLIFALSSYKLKELFSWMDGKKYIALSFLILIVSYYLTFNTTSLNIFSYIEMNGLLYTFVSMILLSLIIALSSFLILDLANALKSSSISGMVASVFSLGCPTCGSIIYSLLGITAGLSILPFQGIEVKLFSLVLLVYSVNTVYNRNKVPKEVKLENPTPNPSSSPSSSIAHPAVLALLFLLLPVVVYSQIQIAELNSAFSTSSSPSFKNTGNSIAAPRTSNIDVYSLSSTAQTVAAVFPELREATTEEEVMEILFPVGDPSYSADIGGVTYDDPVNSMEYLAKYYFVIREEIKENNPEVWNRYLKLAAAPRGISCEFCCGVGPQGIDSQGNIRCGCKHNLALQGLTLALMSQTDLSDEEILREVMKWKTLFFPRNMISLGVELAGKDPSEIKSLPGMVGGC